MINLAKVQIWNILVGAVAWREDAGYATFEFDSAFLKTGLDLSPLKMPLQELQNGKLTYSFPTLNYETYKGLPGLLADSLPDKFGNRLIDNWLVRQGRDYTSINPVERLCYTGKRGMGALEYEPALPSLLGTSNPIEINELVKLARNILSDKKKLKINLHNKTDDALLELLRVGTSAGGARAKAIIAYNPTTGEVRSGQIDGLSDFEYWIIKFDGVINKQLGDPKEYGKIEYAYYLMAKECNINMPESKLLKENKRAHFMTKRFDRDGTNKLHMQTLCAIAHFDYNDPALYSYEQVFQIMRQLKLPYTDMTELFRRMIFNVIARNQDDHTKNISFIMDRSGKWRLSPAYDMTYSFDPKNKWMGNHQMSINGKRNDINRNDILTVAQKMNIKKPNEIIDQIKDTISKWDKFAQDAGISSEQIATIKKVMLTEL